MGRVDRGHVGSFTPQQILAQRPGTWGDYELLDDYNYFEERGDRARTMAVLELLLHSPEHSDAVAYDELYFEMTQYARHARDYPTALRWAYGALAYQEQHQQGLNRADTYREIGELYLLAGRIDSGLTLLTRCLKAAPAESLNYYSLVDTLPAVGLADLALEALDAGLAVMPDDDPEELWELMGAEQEHVQAQAAEEKSRLAEVAPDVLDDLRVALQPPAGSRPKPNVYLPPVDRLIDLEEAEVEATYEAIMAQGDVLAPDLIRLAFDEKLWQTPAPVHAVAILRHLAAEYVVELSELVPWLDRAEGDWPRELLTEWAGKIGGYYTDELIVIANDITYDQYLRASIVTALIERSQKCPEQYQHIVESMRILLTRPEAHEAAEETFIAMLISSLLEKGMKELYPEIEAAFAEDRVDPTVIDLQSVQKGFGMPITPRPKVREDGLTLLLKCNICGRAREHFVQHVTIDTLTQEKQAAGKMVKYDAVVMDREIVCPKCGARDQFSLTPQAFARVMVPDGGLSQLITSFGSQDTPKMKLHPRVSVLGSVAFGRPMHPLEALEKYQKLAKMRPKSAEPYFRMGMLLRVIHRYPQMLEAFRKGYEADSGNPEFILNRAMAEHDFGDRVLASELYAEVMKLLAEQPGEDAYYSELGRMARRGQRALERSKQSPWKLTSAIGDNAPSPKKPGWARRRKGRQPKKKHR